MKMWWEGKTGLAKAAAILAAVLLVSTGLCRVNFVVGMDMFRHGGDGGDLLVVATGMIELAAMAASAAGLIVIAVLYVAQTMRGRSTGRKQGE